jgi:hypothetical protein
MCRIKNVQLQTKSNVGTTYLCAIRECVQLQSIYLECGLLAAYKDTGNNIGLRDPRKLKRLTVNITNL